ncbi:MAG: helix-turn-helix transcriptional regulator [Sediminibacterium sp.]
MFTITYLEEKILTRESFKLSIETQESCKVIYSSSQIEDYCNYYEAIKQPPDLCIIADSYNYLQILKVIKAVKARNNHTYILLKSDAKFMKAICYLMKNGLNGIFFTDEPLIDLKKCARTRTRFNLSADKAKLITSNLLSEINIRELNYNDSPLTQNEVNFIQQCSKDLNYDEIATALNKSVNTIYGYRDRVFKKLHVKQRAAMVMTALRRNYIDL